MKKIIVLVAFAVLSGAYSMAFENGGTEEGDRGPQSFKHKHGPCAKVNLTDEQKAKMKSERLKFEEAKIDLQAQVKRARLKYRGLMETPGTDYKAAKAAAQDVTDAVSKMLAARQAFKTKVAFEVLKPEQREPAMQCQAHFKHGHHHRGNWG